MPIKKKLVNHKQAEFNFLQDREDEVITALDMGFGKWFHHNDNTVMRLKPVNFLNNSSLIIDCIQRRRVFVGNPFKGTLYVINGDDEVTPLNAKITLQLVE
jgi:hypothetical protein